MKRVGSYEAKTHLPRLLDEVEAGETITITKRGRVVAVLMPPRPDRSSAFAAAESLRAFRREHRLRGVRIKDLINEGRRR